MFEDADPLLDRVRALALALPETETEERIQHGRPWFAIVGRPAFAVYGFGTKGPDRVLHPRSVVVHVDDDERPVQDPRFYVPAYIGGKGWLGIDVDGPDTDWDEVAELLDASWRHRAPKRLLL